MATNKKKVSLKIMSVHDDNWGGVRKGAGRPSEDGQMKDEQIVARVSSELKKIYVARGGSRWLRSALTTEIDPVEPSHSEMPFVVNSGFAGVPFFDYSIQAGFTEPSESDASRTLDFNEFLIRDEKQTIVLRVSGQSMIEAGIDDGDLVVVDRGRTASNGDIVVMQIDNEYTIKRLIKKGSEMYLKAENRSGQYSDIYPEEGEEWKVFGVVSFTIKSMH